MICVMYIVSLYRAVYEELGKYGSIENQLLCRQRVEEVEPMIGFCSRILGGSSLQEDELLNMENEGPANDLLKAKMEVFPLCTAVLA
jgi:signal recognition particle subunit SRP68